MHAELTCPLGHTCGKCLWYKTRQVCDKANPALLREVSQCEISWIADLSMEGAINGYRTGAAVESFRNEMVVSNGSIARAIMISADERLRLIDDSK